MIKIEHVYTTQPWTMETHHQSDEVLRMELHLGEHTTVHDYVVVLQTTTMLMPYKFHTNQRFKALRHLVKLKHEYIRNYIESNNLQFLET
jgi:hypothetical protein